MFNQAPASIEKRWPANTDDYAKITLNLNAIEYDKVENPFFSIYKSKFNKGKYNENTGLVSLFDVYKTSSISQGGYGSVETDEEIVTVSPLTPIILIPDGDKLPLIETALGDNNLGGSAYIVPAIFLKYNNDKIRNDYIKKGIVTALDVATIYFSGGTALATKVTWIRRAWAIAEVTGAVGNIGVNTTDVSPQVKEVVNIYNLGMGVIGLKNLSVGGYKFIKALPETTKTLLQQNKGLRNSLIAYYTKWKTLTTNLDNLSDAEKQLVKEQEDVWKALGVMEDGAMVYKSIKYEDFIATVGDFAGGAKQDLAEQAYKLWGEEKWSELEKLFKDNNLNGGWPPFNGAKSIGKIEMSSQLVGKVFDRFQVGKYADGLGGGFASPVLNSNEGVADLVFTYDSRALASKIQEGTYYYKFKIKDEVPGLFFEYGEAIPWFGYMGTADQVKSNLKFNDILSHIEIIEKLKFEGGKWINVKK